MNELFEDVKNRFEHVFYDTTFWYVMEKEFPEFYNKVRSMSGEYHPYMFALYDKKNEVLLPLDFASDEPNWDMYPTKILTAVKNKYTLTSFVKEVQGFLDQVYFCICKQLYECKHNIAFDEDKRDNKISFPATCDFKKKLKRKYNIVVPIELLSLIKNLIPLNVELKSISKYWHRIPREQQYNRWSQEYKSVSTERYDLCKKNPNNCTVSILDEKGAKLKELLRNSFEGSVKLLNAFHFFLTGDKSQYYDCTQGFNPDPKYNYDHLFG